MWMRDGDEDLVVKFLIQQTGIPCGDYARDPVRTHLRLSADFRNGHHQHVQLSTEFGSATEGVWAASCAMSPRPLLNLDLNFNSLVWLSGSYASGTSRGMPAQFRQQPVEESHPARGLELGLGLGTM